MISGTPSRKIIQIILEEFNKEKISDEDAMATALELLSRVCHRMGMDFKAVCPDAEIITKGDVH